MILICILEYNDSSTSPIHVHVHTHTDTIHSQNSKDMCDWWQPCTVWAIFETKHDYISSLCSVAPFLELWKYWSHIVRIGPFWCVAAYLRWHFITSNGSWCMGIKGEMSGTVLSHLHYIYIYMYVCIYIYTYIYELFTAFVCFVVCSLL